MRQAAGGPTCLSKGPCARSTVRTLGGRVPCLSNIHEWFPARKKHASGGPQYWSDMPGMYSSSDGRACRQELPILPIWQALLAKFLLLDFLMFEIWQALLAKLNEHQNLMSASYSSECKSPPRHPIEGRQDRNVDTIASYAVQSPYG